MRSDFLFKLLDRVGPVDRFGRLIVIGDVLVERGFQGRGTDKMIGLQMFALQETEPDFDLIQPGRIGRQPLHLEVQSPVTRAFLLLEPAFELLRRVGGAIVQDEGHRVDPPPKGFGNDHLLEKGLEIDKALALAAGSVDLAIGDGQSSKQMACTTTMITCFMEQRLAWACWARRLFSLACLNGGFLIQTDQPRACLQEDERLSIGLQHGARPLQEGDRIMDVLPGMRAPGTKTFRFEPATHRTGRDVRKRRVLGHAAGQFGSTPPREGHLALLGQATGDGRHLCAHLRGKNAAAPHCGARQQVNGS